MIAQMLMATSAAIILLLGIVHMIYTFRGSKLLPRDLTLQEDMAKVSPGISAQTTMWKAWVGFNASHSLGAMLFGLIYGYFAVAQVVFLFQSSFMLAVGFCMLVSLVVLGKKYWFSVPFRAVSVALACYVASVAIARV